MLVQVTKRHIEQGVRNSAGRCPVALAVKALGYESVQVNSWSCYYSKSAFIDDGFREGKMPEMATQFIKAFDKGDAVDPITFILE